MGKRRRFSRWRRLPGVYRFGDDKPADPNAEPQRLTLYVPGTALDLAEILAVRLGFRDAQEFCTEVVLRAIEAEHIKEQVAGVEAKHGPLGGWHEIAEDADYLAELSRLAVARSLAPPVVVPAPPQETPETLVSLPKGNLDRRDEISYLEAREQAQHAKPTPRPASANRAIEQASFGPPAGGDAAEVILRHAGQAGDDPYAFLPCLRRGESVPPAEVAELAQALSELEREYRTACSMDRGLTFALHRLAFESQILSTDAWPGAFDLWTVDMVRAVQEAVERILSGCDIRYYPSSTDAEPPMDGSHPPEASH